MATRRVAVDLDFQNVSRILNLPQASANGQPVTYEQLKAAIESIAWKDNARVAAQGNVNLAAPGASQDGITMVAGDRELLRNQTDPKENGIYVWNGAATPMTRAADADTFDELESAVVGVDEGTDAGTQWRQTQVNGVLGTDNVIWVSFAVAVPDATETTAGKAEIATQAETDAGADDARIITPLKLANWTLRKLKNTATIGDGSALVFSITHNFNTRDVLAQVYANGGNYDTVDTDVQRPTVNRVDIGFTLAPAVNGYRAILLA